MGGGEQTAARIAELLGVVEAFARLDFSREAHVGRAGDDLDALAAGIHMLGEEVEFAHRELEQRVSEATALTGRLEDEVAERRRAEVELEKSIAEVNKWSRHLQWLNDQVKHLTEMSNFFQVCADRDQAFAVLGRLGPQLFTGTDGEVFVFVASRDVIELVTRWGETEKAVPPTVAPDECWALRRGRLHHGQGEGGLRCGHMPDGVTGETLCVPLIAHGEILGLLHVRWQESEQERSAPRGMRAEYEELAVAAGEQIALALANLELRAALRAQSIRDPLTGLYNRRYLDETLGRELRRAEREETGVSFLMVDIDRFKRFNDAYGHAAGDAVLREVAELLLRSVRGEDVVCRYGGEELAVVMAGIDQTKALDRAEQIRALVEESPFTWHGQPLGKLTVSIGLAAYPDHASTGDQLVRSADAALYEAKSRGRNRVTVATAPGSALRA